MSIIDWMVFALFIGWVVIDGIRRGSKSTNLEGYFAGGRSIPWWAAGLSVMATQASAITVIGTTGQGHDHGMSFVQIYFAMPLALVLICVFFVPLYRRAPILTAYEYLEHRFGPATRTLASAVFLISRCLAFGVVIYAPSVVLAALLDIDATVAVVAIGSITTLYTMIGGVSAVIWTDVKQMVVIIGGLFALLAILLWQLVPQLGFSGILEVAGAAGKLDAVVVEPASTSFIPRASGASDGMPSFWEEKYNLWSGMFGGLFLMLSYFGCDQSQVQRILTNPTANESRKALLMSGFAKIPMQLVVLFLGVLLFVHHGMNGGKLLYDPDHQAAFASEQIAEERAGLEARFETAETRQSTAMRELAAQPGDVAVRAEYRAAVTEVVQVRKDARQLAFATAEGKALDEVKPPKDTNFVFPSFLLDSGQVPPLLLGLLIAAIFAAAMSSADSALNSLTSATVVDFYKRWVNPSVSDRGALIASRVCTVFWGAAATIAALSFEGGGSVIEIVNKIGSFFYGSLLGVFLLALFVPRAGSRAAFFGILAGMGAVLLVHFTLRVEFLWYNLVGAVAVLVVGVALAPLDARRAAH